MMIDEATVLLWSSGPGDHYQFRIMNVGTSEMLPPVISHRRRGTPSLAQHFGRRLLGYILFIKYQYTRFYNYLRSQQEHNQKLIKESETKVP